MVGDFWFFVKRKQACRIDEMNYAFLRIETIRKIMTDYFFKIHT
jgi:hypothetical protein